MSICKQPATLTKISADETCGSSENSYVNKISTLRNISKSFTKKSKGLLLSICEPTVGLLRIFIENSFAHVAGRERTGNILFNYYLLVNITTQSNLFVSEEIKCYDKI